jgi:hypothetical protein
MSDFLIDQGISADFYHAGQTPQQRKVVQAAWSTGLVKVHHQFTNRRFIDTFSQRTKSRFFD